MEENIQPNIDTEQTPGRILVRLLKRHKLDIIIAASLFVIITLVSYVVLGFAKNGLTTPYVYSGGDDTGFYFTVKQINDTGWGWDYSRVGAPFDYHTNFSFAGSYTMNADYFLIMLFSLFTNNVAVILNCFILCVFPLGGLCAYIVCRKVKLNYLFASLCSVLYAFAPYVFWRTGGHFNLILCCFVPFSILLCIWSFDTSDKDYMKFQNGFSKKGKNVASIIMCFLIANNGIGYYPIFSCYFLGITMLLILLKEKKLSCAVAAIKNIAFIAVFFLINIIPNAISILSGTTHSTERLVSDAELYGLKLATLFLPLTPTGPAWLQDISSTYYSNTVTQNESNTAFLGLAGIIGFVISLVILLGAEKLREKGKNELVLMSRLNIFAILLGSVGGFSALIGMFFKFIRGYNRISIFILFISLITLFIFIQENLWVKIKESGKVFRKVLLLICVSAVCAVSVIGQIPTIGGRDLLMEQYSELFYDDYEFYQEMERTLGENASVFQLPYIGFESSPINNMAPYDHYKGYVHTETLKWSFGSGNGSDPDRWWRNTSSLPAKEMIDTICKAGMSALLINSKAYGSEELERIMRGVESITEQPPVISEDGVNIYYDLRPYIARSGIGYDANSLVLGNADLYGGAILLCAGIAEKGFNEIILHSGGVQFGPYCEMEQGTYRITVHGENLTNAGFDCYSYSIDSTLEPYDEILENNMYQYVIDVPEAINRVEIRTFNSSNTDVIVSYIEVEKLDQ